MTHYGIDDIRSEFMRKSVTSILENTDYPYQFIVVDNGGDENASKFLQKLTQEGKIHVYIKNTENMGFGYARNQGIGMAHGDYICSIDNDVVVKKNWMKNCIKVLEAHPNRKIFATPICSISHDLPKWWSKDKLKVGNETYRLNHRAGPNCFVGRKESFEEVGYFLAHRIAGTKWLNASLSKGYLYAVTPRIEAKDLGLRIKRNYKKAEPIKITLSNGIKLYFNQDEYREENEDKIFIKQHEG